MTATLMRTYDSIVVFSAVRLVMFGAGGGGVHAVVEFAENHLAGRGLKHAGDGDIDGLRDHLLGVVHHHHGAIVEIGDALVVLLALFQNEHAHGLPGQHDGLERVSQLVDVQHFNAVKLRYLIQIEIVGDHFAIEDLGQLNQLHVHFAHVRKILFYNLHVEMRHFLHPLQNVQPAAAAVALHGIGRIGHQLQLAQHELRNHQHAIEKAGLGDIGDAPIDDHAGIEDLERLLRSVLHAEDAAEGRQIEHVALGCAHHQPDIAHEQQHAHLHKRLGVGFGEHERYEERSEDAQHRAECGADQAREADALQPDFKKDDRAANEEAAAGRNPRRKLKRVKRIRGNRKHQDEDCANNHQIEQECTPFGNGNAATELMP
jgi:hypothetical protein